MVQNCILNGTCGYIGDLVGSPVPSRNALFSTLWGTLRAIGCCTVSEPVQFQRFIPHAALRPLLPTLPTALFMKHTQLLLLFLLHPSIHLSIHPSINRSIDPSIHRSIHSSIHPCMLSIMHRHLCTATWFTLCYGWRVGIVHTKCVAASTITATAAPRDEL